MFYYPDYLQSLKHALGKVKVIGVMNTYSPHYHETIQDTTQPYPMLTWKKTEDVDDRGNALWNFAPRDNATIYKHPMPKGCTVCKFESIQDGVKITSKLHT